MDKMDRDTIRDIDELEYVIFCIENVAARLGKDARQVYQVLTEKSDILDSYIIPNFDILHKQDKMYIVNDILSVMEEEGVEI